MKSTLGKIRALLMVSLNGSHRAEILGENGARTRLSAPSRVELDALIRSHILGGTH